MNGMGTFLGGAALGVVSGAIVGLELRRVTARVIAGAGRLGLVLGGARRMLVLFVAFVLGSRLGAAGLVGVAAGTLAGMTAVVALAVREPVRG